ncbi:hypothetical protein DPV78_008595 [Talaromyces pinophilus]|nr:hypothetical protein DPV78_008595 [Talaromyces pinophilus]
MAATCPCGYGYNNCFSSLLRTYAAHTPELLSEAERLLSADPDDHSNMSTEDVNGADDFTLHSSKRIMFGRLLKQSLNLVVEKTVREAVEGILKEAIEKAVSHTVANALKNTGGRSVERY